MKSLAGTMSPNVHSVHPHVFDLGYLHSASSLCIVTHLIRSGRTAMCWAFFLWWLWAGPQHVCLAVRQRAYGMSRVLVRTQNLLPVEVTYSFQNTKKTVRGWKPVTSVPRIQVTSLNFPSKHVTFVGHCFFWHIWYIVIQVTSLNFSIKDVTFVRIVFSNFAAPGHIS